ncbi:MAG: hypothetical protein KDC65_18145, partial [Saprospiraceae bacterium]|nr:hypothetical protein [Saprospiraceae bacterium]
MLSKVFLPLALILFASDVMAQGGLPMPRNLQAAFDKGTRSHDGMPGKMYWQNSADYDISVEFDPTTRLIAGTESIVYYNNSPDTLREIAFFLYPNLYRKGSR